MPNFMAFFTLQTFVLDTCLRTFDSRSLFLGVQKLTQSVFKWGFGEGLLKDKFVFFEAYKSPIPKRRKLLAKRPFL